MRKRWKRSMLLSWTGGQSYTQRVIGLGPIAYWPLAETSGTIANDESGNGRNGTYRNTAGVLNGVTLGAAGIGDGRTAASFDGSAGLVNIYSAALAAAFNKDELSIAVWFKVPAAGAWTDGADRIVVQLMADVNNRAFIYKPAIPTNKLVCVYNAGGTSKSEQIATTTTGWASVIMTVSKSGDKLLSYLNGGSNGAGQTGLGVWAGALASANCCIGAFNTSASTPWNGAEQHVVVFDRALTPAQAASIGAL